MEVDAGRGRNEVEGARPLVLWMQKPRPRSHSVMVRIGAGPGIPSPSVCAGLHLHLCQVVGLPSRGSGGAGLDTEPLFARGLGDPPPCG